MITIIKEGKAQIRKCGMCECVFRFEDEDVENKQSIDISWKPIVRKVIECPQCGNTIILGEY